MSAAVKKLALERLAADADKAAGRATDAKSAVRAAKVQLKQARKRLKIAKKAAKQARKKLADMKPIAVAKPDKVAAATALPASAKPVAKAPVKAASKATATKAAKKPRVRKPKAARVADAAPLRSAGEVAKSVIERLQSPPPILPPEPGVASESDPHTSPR